MTHITTRNNWLFEVKVVRAIKCKNYGEPYTALAMISIVDNEVHVESLLSNTVWTKKDMGEVETYIKSLGFSCYYYSRYKSGDKRMVKKRLNND